jgi:Flp pilus assembly protein protease CpaA
MSTLENEIVLVQLPLFLLVLACCINELRTGLIPNAWIFPGMAYVLGIRFYIGDLPWLNYFFAGIFVGGVLLAFGSQFPRFFGSDDWVVGAGAVKLMTLIGFGLGIPITLKVFASFAPTAFMVWAIATWKFERDSVPSSPLILFSFVCGFIWNNFLV